MAGELLHTQSKRLIIATPTTFIIFQSVCCDNTIPMLFINKRDDRKFHVIENEADKNPIYYYNVGCHSVEKLKDNVPILLQSNRLMVN